MSLEVMQLGQSSSQEDLTLAIQWLKDNFQNTSVEWCQISIKRNQNKIDSNIQLHEYVKNREQIVAKALPSGNTIEQSRLISTDVPSGSSEIDNIYRQAQQYFKDNQHAKAKEQYKKCLFECYKDEIYFSKQIDCQIYIANCDIVEKNHDNAIENLLNTIQKIKQHNGDVNQTNQAYQSLAIAHQQLNQPEKAIEYLQLAIRELRSLEHLDQEKQKSIGHILNNLGMQHEKINKPHEAVDYFLESLEIYQNIDGMDKISIANRYNNLAESYRQIKEYENAEKYFLESLNLKKQHLKNQNDKSIANTCTNLGNTYAAQKNSQQVIQYAIQAVSIYKLYDQTTEIQNQICVNYFNLGNSHQQLKNLKEQLNYFQEAYNLKKVLTSNSDKSTLKYGSLYAQALYQNKQFSESVSLFRQLEYTSTQIYGEESLNVAQIKQNLGTVLCEDHQFDEGIAEIKRTQKILTQMGSDQKTLDKLAKNIASYENKRLRYQNND